MHVVIDDHSRYLYVEQHDHEHADTNADTLTRALAHFAELGVAGPQAVMTGPIAPRSPMSWSRRWPTRPNAATTSRRSCDAAAAAGRRWGPRRRRSSRCVWTPS
ncbi:MAG: hypothetical protein ACRDNS_33655 [Trebonia sp.]